jgi:SPP1 gp7 family putative phage head morphogenesis protein
MAIAMNGSRYETYVRNGVVKHMWSATQDERTRDSHFYLNGEVRNVGEEFAKNLRFPGDPNAPAEEVINCRCTTVPVSRLHPAFKGGDVLTSTPRQSKKVPRDKSQRLSPSEVKDLVSKGLKIRKGG